jgi:hypothetical protein
MAITNQVINMDTVSYDDILAFVAEKQLDKKCELCGCAKWYLTGTSKNRIQHIEIWEQFKNTANVLTANQPLASREAYFCYCLVCADCGYIRWFSKYAVYLHKQKDKNIESGQNESS